jgi:hypothetical protein
MMLNYFFLATFLAGFFAAVFFSLGAGFFAGIGVLLSLSGISRAI